MSTDEFEHTDDERNYPEAGIGDPDDDSEKIIIVEESTGDGERILIVEELADDGHDDDEVDTVAELVTESETLDSFEELVENLEDAVKILIIEHQPATQKQIDDLRDNWLDALRELLPGPPEDDGDPADIRKDALALRHVQELIDQLEPVLLEATEDESRPTTARKGGV
jgi:hypothetical protein